MRGADFPQLKPARVAGYILGDDRLYAVHRGVTGWQAACSRQRGWSAWIDDALTDDQQQIAADEYEYHGKTGEISVAVGDRIYCDWRRLRGRGVCCMTKAVNILPGCIGIG